MGTPTPLSPWGTRLRPRRLRRGRLRLPLRLILRLTPGYTTLASTGLITLDIMATGPTLDTMATDLMLASMAMASKNVEYPHIPHEKPKGHKTFHYLCVHL